MNSKNNMQIAYEVPSEKAVNYYGDDGLLYCGICHEAKEAYWPEEKRFFGSDRHRRMCACEREAQERAQQMMRQEQIRKLKDMCFTEPVMKDWTFENSLYENSQTAYCRKYADEWDKRSSPGLLLWGDVGTGKTYMAASIANALLEKEISVYMTTISDVIDYGFEGRSEFIRKLCSYDLLILDDFGMERDTSFGQETSFRLIDKRVASGKPMIITTNLHLSTLDHPKDLDHRRIYSRVRSVTAPIRFEGENYRQYQQKKVFEKAQKLFGREDG